VLTLSCDDVSEKQWHDVTEVCAITREQPSEDDFVDLMKEVVPKLIVDMSTAPDASMPESSKRAHEEATGAMTDASKRQLSPPPDAAAKSGKTGASSMESLSVTVTAAQWHQMDASAHGQLPSQAWLRADAISAVVMVGGVWLCSSQLEPVLQHVRQDPVGVGQQWQQNQKLPLQQRLEMLVPGVGIFAYQLSAIGAVIAVVFLAFGLANTLVGLME
ncbi:unnamed protein product, partial [Cladocopium goreaui]